MSEARRLLEEMCRGHNARGSDGPCDCDACRFLAQPMTKCEEHEAVLAKALRRMMDYSPALVPGCDTPPKRVFVVSAQEQADAYGEAFHALADTSQAAKELLAREGELVAALGLFRLGESDHFFGCGVFHKLDKECSPACVAARAAIKEEVDQSDG
ncbi:hypothetical protein LCGC14_1011080 [marine sediment metagenome]|uniref:Uncharacterized protein n=1 Tax=marine sediment metagenome TaxID=412755 RepID=A0A0F9QII5_9ZZZZ